MVRLAASVAINSEGVSSETQTGETAEYQEGRIHATYQEALNLEHTGNKVEAQVSYPKKLYRGGLATTPVKLTLVQSAR